MRVLGFNCSSIRVEEVYDLGFCLGVGLLQSSSGFRAEGLRVDS